MMEAQSHLSTPLNGEFFLNIVQDPKSDRVDVGERRNEYIEVLAIKKEGFVEQAASWEPPDWAANSRIEGPYLLIKWVGNYWRWNPKAPREGQRGEGSSQKKKRVGYINLAARNELVPLLARS